MFLISNGHSYIGLGADNTQTTVRNINKAISFSERQKAINYRDNLKTTLRKFDWKIVEVNDPSYSDTESIQEEGEEEVCDIEISTYVETGLEQKSFNISEFFKTTIQTVSQLRQYASNMNFLEKEYNKKILDVRHYKRDIKTKLNAIQLQRLEKFEIQLERERYECKSNRLIAEMFLSDLNKMEDINYIETIKNIKESEYKPKVFTYELLDEIVGKRGNI